MTANRCTYFAPLLALAVVATATAMFTTVSAQDNDVVRGEKIVQDKCARCHAIGRADASPNSAAPPFRTLAAKYPLHFLAESLAEGISTGHNDMPEFVFDPAEIDAVLGYIGSISDQKPAGGR